MSLSHCSLHEAYVTNRANPEAFWTPHNASAGASAAERLARGKFFTPKIPRTFELHRDDAIFTMGSCFTRNIELMLEKQGFRITSYARELRKYKARRDNDINAAYNFLNRFNVFSIANEMRWALDPSAEYSEESLVRLPDNTAIDPHAHFTLSNVSPAETMQRRRELTRINSRIKKTRIVFLALGLSEVWRDDKTGLYINFSPTKEMSEAEPDRFSLHVASYEETISALEEIHSLLVRHGHHDFRLVLAIDPVPLVATFRNQDIVLANCYGKSVLRAAVEAACTRPRTHYFPCYEIVTASPYTHVWREDRRHPSAAVTKHMVELFLSTYMADTELDDFSIHEFEHRHLLIELAQRFKLKGKPYALFGAGKFCRRILLTLRKESLPLPSYILDDNPTLDILHGIPVVRPEEVDPSSIEDILVASDSFAACIRDRIMEVFGKRMTPLCLDEISLPQQAHGT